jgi:hypothetical protein
VGGGIGLNTRLRNSLAANGTVPIFAGRHLADRALDAFGLHLAPPFGGEHHLLACMASMRDSRPTLCWSSETRSRLWLERCVPPQSRTTPIRGAQERAIPGAVCFVVHAVHLEPLETVGVVDAEPLSEPVSRSAPRV